MPVSKKRPYSMDRNIWHLSHEGSDLEDPWNEPKKDLCLICTNPEDAPDIPAYVEVDFEQGVPIAVDGKKLSPRKLLETLNALGAANGPSALTIWSKTVLSA